MILGTVVALALSGCAGDASAVYDDAATKVLQGALSDSRTAELAARLWLQGRSTHALAVVTADESDAGVGREAAWFEAQQPPTHRSDEVRERTVAALDAASSAVQDLRIAVSRSDGTGTRAALADVDAACSELETLAQELG